MFRIVPGLLLLALCVAIGLTPASAADVAVTRVTPAYGSAGVLLSPGFKHPQPRHAYGCKRVWRCDAQICEWRRGCYGVYGYMEGPYYSLALAQRQWERDGWPTPGSHRQR